MGQGNGGGGGGGVGQSCIIIRKSTSSYFTGLYMYTFIFSIVMLFLLHQDHKIPPSQKKGGGGGGFTCKTVYTRRQKGRERRDFYRKEEFVFYARYCGWETLELVVLKNLKSLDLAVYTKTGLALCFP